MFNLFPLKLPSLGLLTTIIAMSASFATAQGISFDEPIDSLDEEVDACLASEGVSVLPDTKTICYNAAIFPGQFLQLADMDPADRIIITSPGGNVATARMMSRILDQRDEPIVIAGQCMSACAMVLVPGADELWIHHSAHISVHGIVMMGFDQWFGWLKDGEDATKSERILAGLGYNFPYTLHKSGQDHMIDHLKGQGVDADYIEIVSDRMLADALNHDCRVDPNEYWGMIDAAHLKRFLGDRIAHMERFAQSWSDPVNTVYKDVTVPIAEQTYIFQRDYNEAGCAASD
ncbi:hypothetical protein WNY37_10585 [Henriciella sp. AS95]|uniref:hypothetical protein n=1 Tax=Henriciella sp. AS95 TaxID=3135782 RepID=UPI00317F07A6